MSRYRFALEKVLAYRRLREEEQLRRLSSAYRRQQQAEALLAAYREELGREQELAAGVLELEERQHLEACLEAAVTRVKKQEEAVACIKAEVKQLEEQAIRATQEREILDRLKSKQLALFQYEEGRREQREMDELALLRFGWKEGGEDIPCRNW